MGQSLPYTYNMELLSQIVITNLNTVYGQVTTAGINDLEAGKIAVTDPVTGQLPEELLQNVKMKVRVV